MAPQRSKFTLWHMEPQSLSMTKGDLVVLAGLSDEGSISAVASLPGAVQHRVSYLSFTS